MLQFKDAYSVSDLSGSYSESEIAQAGYTLKN